MLLRLAALGALGYAGYRYWQKNGGDVRSALGLPRRQGADGAGPGQTATPEPDLSDPRVAMAGGPLSEQAMLVEPGQLPAG